MSWVHNVVRQLVYNLPEVLWPEEKAALVRKERAARASGDRLSDKAGRAAPRVMDKL